MPATDPPSGTVNGGGADAVFWTRAAIDAVRQISGAIDIKRPLRELGVRRDMLASLAPGALADAVTRNAPRRPSEDQILGILDAAC